MADVRKYARLKGTIQALQRKKIRIEHVKHATAKAKEKLDYATQQNEQDLNEQVSDQAQTYVSESHTAVRRTINDARRIRQKAAKAKTKRTSPQYSAAETYGQPEKTSTASHNQAEHPAMRGSTRPVAKANPVMRPSSRSTTAVASKPISEASKPISVVPKPSEMVRGKQIQKARQTVQHSAQTAQRAKMISAQIRKRAAAAARSASKAAVSEARSLLVLLAGGGALSLLIVTIVVLFGCGIALFGGGSGSSYTPVSAKVEAYDPIIRQYAKQFHIGEYADLIKAVMMQESGGQGSDPMQASECGYNTRFPRKPNGITDPAYSIQVGIQELAACLRLADVENPVDMEHIRLALQGYNYGEGYITWAKSHYGGYSIVNAMEYSTMMAERNHWDSYGDRNYVNHVLQYYPLGHAFLPGGGQALVEVARSQLGNVGGEPYWSWYGFPERVEWCACFVSWCADQCGLIESGVVPKFSYCDDGIAWFQSQGHWKGRTEIPQSGDMIFFDWDHDGHANHVGIVEFCEDGVVYTIEGNSSNKCMECRYEHLDHVIMGCGVIQIRD